MEQIKDTKDDTLGDGYTCSEHMILAFADRLGYEMETALKMSCGLSGGMAQGKTCGAVVAAFMIISYKYSSGKPNDQFSRELIYQIIQEFSHRFILRNGSIECKKILLQNHIDFQNPEDMKQLREKGICNPVVAYTAELLAGILTEDF